MLTGNKGEWSEIYVLLRLLGDAKLYPGDADLNPVSDIFYPILNIIRCEDDRVYTYKIGGEDWITVEVEHNDEKSLFPAQKKKFPVARSEFKEQADNLLEKIKNSTTGSFASPDTETFMQHIQCSTIRANSTKKSDIDISIHDRRTGMRPVLGFSIKSQIGSPATLLNASKSTNFQYKLKGNLSADEIEEINAIVGASKVKNRLFAIQEKGIKLEFAQIIKNTFKNNLALIDSLLPNILSEILLDFYSKSQNKSMNDLVAEMKRKNPLNFDLSQRHNFYEYKIKKFLTDTALGMTPAKVWNGEYNATGGYLIVKEGGEIICYHIYDKNKFEDYLLQNTILDTPSTSRHDFGKVYESQGELFFNLNLQVRFVK